MWRQISILLRVICRRSCAGFLQFNAVDQSVHCACIFEWKLLKKRRNVRRMNAYRCKMLTASPFSRRSRIFATFSFRSTKISGRCEAMFVSVHFSIFVDSMPYRFNERSRTRDILQWTRCSAEVQQRHSTGFVIVQIHTHRHGTQGTSHIENSIAEAWRPHTTQNNIGIALMKWAHKSHGNCTADHIWLRLSTWELRSHVIWLVSAVNRCCHVNSSSESYKFTRQ